MIKIKRVYQIPEKSDGYRILVDRLWPRGISKEKAKIDLWVKNLAPSNELRIWFNHDPTKWEIFKQQYFKEIDTNPDLINEIRVKSQKIDITLVFGSKEEHYNNALALKEYIEKF